MPEVRIPLSVPCIRGNEWKYVQECLETGWVSSLGSYVDRFERCIAEVAGTKFAVATVNGTAALHIALLVSGVEPDDEVIVPALTFVAPANAVRYVGAHPLLFDVEPVYWQIDVQRVADFLEKECRWVGNALRNSGTGRRVKALLPVHILGHPVDITALLGLARKYNLAVIEDATESLGAKYNGQAVGTFGDIGCFSFNGNKLITTGGGGMIVTDNEDLAARARHLTTQAKSDPVEYIHDQIGYNYRLTNVQAAIGCAQIEQLSTYITAKRQIAAKYRSALKGVPGITTMVEAPYAFSIFWMFTILVEQRIYGIGSRDLMRTLGESGIQTRPLWQPLHLNLPYKTSSATPCSNAEELYRKALSLPCSVALSDEELNEVTQSIADLSARSSNVLIRDSRS